MSDEVARALLLMANERDPGIAAARFSLNAKTEAKQRAIADHWLAYGIRHALIELGYDLTELKP